MYFFKSIHQYIDSIMRLIKGKIYICTSTKLEKPSGQKTVLAHFTVGNEYKCVAENRLKNDLGYTIAFDPLTETQPFFTEKDGINRIEVIEEPEKNIISIQGLTPLQYRIVRNLIESWNT